jgi:8-oxo-dGTP pyrophosphatase MutT (NUDIX family)
LTPIQTSDVLKVMQITDDTREENKNPAFGGVMIKCANRVLLCKRRADIPNTALPEYWSVPAGYVEPNEEIKECAIRETFEETQIKLNPDDVRFLSAFPAHGAPGVFYDYICEIDEEVEPVIDEEHSEWGYFSIDEIPTPITDELRSDVIIALGT